MIIGRLKDHKYHLMKKGENMKKNDKFTDVMLIKLRNDSIKDKRSSADIKAEGNRFCTAISSPEVLLTLSMPLILIYYSLINGIDQKTAIVAGIVFGVVIYLVVTFLNNIAARYLESERA